MSNEAVLVEDISSVIIRNGDRGFFCWVGHLIFATIRSIN